MRKLSRPIVTACSVLILAISTHASTDPTPALTILLKPAAADARSHITSLDVTVTVAGPAVAAGQPLLQMALVTSNVETVANTLEQLTASDSAGPLPLTSTDDPEGGAAFYRHWRAARATSGAIVIHYRAPISETLAPRGAAPPLELRSDTGAFSGKGETFLMLPESDLPWRLAIRWDLSEMGPGAVGV